MSDLFWLSKAQMRLIEPYFPLSHGIPRVDDRRVVSGIIFVIRNGLRWRDASTRSPAPRRSTSPSSRTSSTTSGTRRRSTPRSIAWKR